MSKVEFTNIIEETIIAVIVAIIGLLFGIIKKIRGDRKKQIISLKEEKLKLEKEIEDLGNKLKECSKSLKDYSERINQLKIDIAEKTAILKATSEFLQDNNLIDTLKDFSRKKDG